MFGRAKTITAGKAQPAYRLGDLLVADGVLAADSLAQALQAQSQQGNKTKLGGVLLAQKLITRRQLFKTLVKQSSLRLYACVFSLFACYQQCQAQDMTLTYCCDQRGYNQALDNGRMLAARQVISSTPTNISSNDVRMVVDYFSGSNSMAAKWRPAVRHINSSYNIDMSSKGAVLNLRWTID